MSFQGSLTELPLPDIIQLVAVSASTGVFDLVRDDSAGSIFLRNGQIVHAETRRAQDDHLGGEEAIYELATWTEGDFVFVPGRETSQTTIERANSILLLEAARRMDEWRSLPEQFHSAQQVPVLSRRQLSGAVTLAPEDWVVLREIDGQRTIGAISVSLGRSLLETCRALSRLVDLDLVAFEPDR